MELLKILFIDWAEFMDGIGILLIAYTYLLGNNTKGEWAAFGCILLIIAIGNAVILLSVNIKPSENLACIFGVMVLGSLGCRFLGEWLTYDKSQKQANKNSRTSTK